MKPYGDVVRILLIYDEDCPSNWCYVVFAMATEVQSAFQSVRSFNIPGLHAETFSSRNVAESHLDYVPNILKRAAEEASPEAREAPTPRWLVVYYCNGLGNFIHATQYLHTEMGHIPMKNVKRIR